MVKISRMDVDPTEEKGGGDPAPPAKFDPPVPALAEDFVPTPINPLVQSLPPTTSFLSEASASFGLAGTPASADIDDDIGKLKKTNAELTRVNHTITCELDSIKLNYNSLSTKNAELKEEMDGVARQLDERLRLFRELQTNAEELRLQKANAEEQVLHLKRDKDEKDLALRRISKEKQIIAVEYEAMKDQLRDLSAQKWEIDNQRQALLTEQRSMKLEANRALDEKSIYEESKRWFMNELSERDNKIANLRLEHGSKEIEWQNERFRLSNDKCNADGVVEDLRVELDLTKKQLTELTDKLSTTVDTHESAMNEVKEELNSREQLNKVLKDQVEKADEAASEMRRMYDSVNEILEQMNEQIENKRIETDRQIEEAFEQVTLRDREIASLRDELEKANELIKNKHNLTLSDEAIEELSPAAAVASRLLKTGGSLTAIYREHARLAAELEEERAKSRLTEESFQEVITQLTDRAPQLMQQKEHLERLMDERERMEEQLRDADKQRRDLLEQRDWASRELSFTKGELERFQRDYSTVSVQVAQLLYVLEKERGQKGRGSSPTDDEDMDASFFNDVKSLVKRNHELESDLNSERVKADLKAQATVNEQTALLQEEVEGLRKDNESIKLFNARIESTLKKIEEQRDSYRRMIEEGGISADAATARRQADDANQRLKEADMKISRLEEWRECDKEEKDRIVNVYEDRISTLSNMITEVKSTNAKLNNELELQRQTAMETYKELEKKTRQVERMIEAESKLRENYIGVEGQLASVKSKLIDMQDELSTLRVDKRSLNEELKMVQSNESRLRAELNVVQHNSYQNDQMLSVLRSMQSRMEVVEAEKKEALANRLDNVESERDQLKNSNAALAERMERLENGHRQDMQRFATEKEDLLAKLDDERNERLSSEKMCSELRAKLVATQEDVSDTDYIGTNPQRLAVECQQLKNQNKFLEGQVEELKKKSEISEITCKKAMTELEKMSQLSNTVETSLTEQSHTGAMERARLEGLLEVSQNKIKSIESELESTKENVYTLENRMRENERIRLELRQQIAVMEVEMKEESSKGTVFEEKIRLINEEKRSIENNLNILQNELIQVKGDLTETKLEKESALTIVQTKENELMTICEQYRNDREGWANEKASLETNYKNALNDIESKTMEMKQLLQKKDEQFNQLMQTNIDVVTRESSTGGDIDSSTDNHSISQILTVNRFLREEKQQTMERLVRAEVEMRRMKVHNEELDEERMRLEGQVAEMQRKAEADAAALSDKAQLMEKLKGSIRMEKENVILKEEKERCNKHIADLEKKIVSLSGENTRTSTQLKNANEKISTLTNETLSKTRENLMFKKSVDEKEAALVKMRSELAESKKAIETGGGIGMGGPRGGVIAKLKEQNETLLKQMKEQHDYYEKEKADILSKNSQLKAIALKYKKQEALAANEPSSPANIKKLQEQKDEMKNKVDELTALKDSLESERDELRMRLSSLSSMISKAGQTKERLEAENNKLKEQLAGLSTQESSKDDIGNVIEKEEKNEMESVSPMKSISNISMNEEEAIQSIPCIVSSDRSSPLKIIDNESSSQSFNILTSEAPLSQSSPLKSLRTPIESVEEVSSVPSTTTQSTSSNIPNMFEETPVEWPDRMTSHTVASSTTFASSFDRKALFGRSVATPVPSSADVSTSSAVEEQIVDNDMEDENDSQQPISSSSGNGRKRGARDDIGDGKRARIEDGDGDGDDMDRGDEVISSSHDIDGDGDGMGEEDTRDGEALVLGDDDDEEDNGDVEVVEEHDEQEDNDDDDDEDEEDEDEEEEEDNDDGDDIIDSDEGGDDESDDGDDIDSNDIRRGGHDDDREDNDDMDDENDDDVQVIHSDDDDNDNGDEEVERGSESDGEELNDDDEGREAIASIDEAEEECTSPIVEMEGGDVLEAEDSTSSIPPNVSSNQSIESTLFEKKKASPIRWDEEAASSSSATTTTTTSVSRRGGSITASSTSRNIGGIRGNQRRGRGSGGGGSSNDMAIQLMRLGRGRSGMMAKRGGRGGGGHK